MSIRDPNLARELSALADGEVDAFTEQRLRQLIAGDPQARAAWQMHHLVSAEARRVLRAAAPSPSPELRERLATLAPLPKDKRLQFSTPRGAGRFVAAASVLLAFAAGVFWGRAERPAPPTAPSPDVIPAAVISHVEKLHGICSRLALGLHEAGYPADVASLAPAVESDLRSNHPYPNLSSIGYQYRGAGPCGWPLPDAAHLLYRSLRPGSVNALSVFVQRWEQQYPLAAGRLYTVSVAPSPFPMLAWRSEHVVYFLIADSRSIEEEALQLIRRPTASPTP